MARSLAILIRRLFWLLLAALLVLFSINNRDWLVLSFDPFPVSVTLPVYGILFLGIFIGLMVAGMVTGWLRLQGFTKRRQVERRANYLECQVSAMAEDAHKAHAATAHAAASEAAEALPNRTNRG
jgi:uncharacterized membrane protein YcjF (UPF0283 family)